MLDRLTRRAANLTCLFIAALLIGLHPDMTATLRVLCTLALVVGWLAAGAPRPWVVGVWTAVAILAPAPLRLLAGREGPVLDLFWMAGLTASLLRLGTWHGWSLQGWMRAGAVAWALTLVLAWPVLAARELSFSPQLMLDFGSVNAWTGWTAPHVVSWIAFVSWTHLLGLLWLDWLAGRFADQPDRAARILHPIWLATTVASAVAIYQGVVDMETLNTALWAGDRRAPGTMLDANAFGFCAALAGPSALLALRTRAWVHAVPIAAAVTVVNLTGLWMSGSRTAALCGVIACGAAVAALWRAGTHHRVIAVASAAAVVAAVVIMVSPAAGPARRLFERPEGTTGGLASAIFLRGAYGQVAHEMIRDYPLTGVGIGMFPHAAADYWRRDADEALPFDHAQNWWRHQAAELGLLGALPLFAWSAWLAWQVLAGARRGAVFTQTVVRGALLAIGIVSIVQFPTQTPAVLLWFFVFVAWLPQVVGARPEPTASTPRWAVAVTAMTVGLAVAYAAGHLLLARGPLAVVERARTFARPYVIGAYPAEPFEEGGVFHWTTDEARFIWQAQRPTFMIRLWASHPDIEQRPVRVTMTTPCGRLFERQVDTHVPIALVVTLPPGVTTLDVTVGVSRTWRPAAAGLGSDTRALGIAVSADSIDGQEPSDVTARLAWPVCGL